MRLCIFILGCIAALGCGPNPVEPIHANKAALEGATRPSVESGDWPWWRGPQLDNHAGAEEIPLEWSESENVLWRTAIPGRGHSTPVLWGDRVFVTTAQAADETKRLICLDRQTGKEQWSTVIHRGGFMHIHSKNSQASATPACDGEYVYTAFMVEHDGQKAIWMTAVDFEGKIVWQKSAGPFSTMHGYGSSPVLYKSLIIVAGDNGKSGFLTALERKSGRVHWRVPRPQKYSFATPVVAQVAGRTQVLLHGCNLVTSYDPDTGKELWRCRGPANSCANTITHDDARVYASGGYPQKELLAIRADGSGDVSETHVVWRKGRAVCYVPTMLIDDGKLYSINDKGIGTCYNADTGDVLWQERLSGGFSASPLLVGKRLYVSNEAGVTFVLSASDKFEVLAKNNLGDGGFASPVAVGGKLFLRTNHALFCIGRSAGD